MQQAEERQREGALVSQPGHESVGEAETEDGTCTGEDKAFEEELADDAGTAGAESTADGELFGAGGGAREQQVGEIDACDEQDGSDGAPEDDKRAAEAAADVVLEGT